jgi:ribosomal protein S18 acetylase RimI-like enzyme
MRSTSATANIRIRQALRDDAQAITDLYAELDEEQWPKERSLREVEWLREVESALGDEHTAVLVADADGILAGTVRLEFAARPYGRIAEVRRLFVSKRWRRQGIASGLMTAVEELASSGDAMEIRLTVLTGNGPAQELYEGRGYGLYAVRLRKVLGQGPD